MRFRLIFLPLLVLAGFLLVPLSVGAYDSALETCGYVTGVSDYTVPGNPNSGRTDFDLAEWSPDPDDLEAYPPVSSTPISDANRLCFTPDGMVEGDKQWAWNTNAGWIEFNWSGGGSDVTVDLPLTSDMAYTGNAYWSGYAWSDEIGWIWFDWDCSGCDLTKRVRTILPAEWPDLGDTEVWGDIQGFAWNDNVGWLRFGNVSLPSYNVEMDLPYEPQDIYVQPVVEITPDPANVSKYGQGTGFDPAPVADGVSAYTLRVKFVDINEGTALDDTYMPSFAVTPTSDSYVYANQIDRVGPTAITANPITYNAVDQYFEMEITSVAPTSNINGTDKEGDGDIDYFYDQDPSDPTGNTKSSTANQYLIESIEFSVTGPDNVIVVQDDAPLWGLSGESLDLKYTPAIEMCCLERHEEAEDTLVDNLLNEVNVVQNIRGVATLWSDEMLGQTFTVYSRLRSSGYQFLFDSNENGNYIPGEDATEVGSVHTISDFGNPDTYDEWAPKSSLYVPITYDDYFEGLVVGDLGTVPRYVMLVNDEGYTAFAGARPDVMIAGDFQDRQPTFSGKFFNFFFPHQMAKATVGPNLIVSNVYVNAGGTLTIDIENIGDEDVTDESGKLYIWIDDMVTPEWTYSWSTLSPSNQTFMLAGGFSDIQPQGLTGTHTVKACNDYFDIISETDETDNCLTDVVSWGPDLEVTDIYLNASDVLTIDLENTGNGDVTDDSGKLYIWIDDVLEWTYTWWTLSPDNQTFMDAGGFADIQPQGLTGTHTVKACNDYTNIIEETDETDNCLEVEVTASGGTLGPDVTIEDVYIGAGDSLNIQMANIGDEDVPLTHYDGVGTDEGHLYIWIDGVLEWTYSWSTFAPSIKEFLLAGESRTANPQSLTGDHIVEACLDPNENVEETNETNNCFSMVMGEGFDTEPTYETRIAYVKDAFDIQYWSNYLPHSAGGAYYYNVPAYDYKEEVVVVGGITSVAGEDLIGADEAFQVFGDPATIKIRNEIFQRISQLKKGITVNEGDTDWNVVNGAFEIQNEFLQYGVYLQEDEILYFEGDTLIESLDTVYDQKTVVVYGGDLYIHDDFSGDSSIGLVVLTDTSGEGGNVYLHSEVKDLVKVNIYADGSLFSYHPDIGLDTEGLPAWSGIDERRTYLKDQLYLSGSLISKNTIRGTENMILPDGRSTTDEEEARAYDLNDTREFVICWVATDNNYIPVDQDDDGIYEDPDGTWDEGDMEDCIGFSRAENTENTGDLNTSENAPFTIIYSPPPDDLPLLGSESASGVNLF